jgi:hypothetical protein
LSNFNTASGALVISVKGIKQYINNSFVIKYTPIGSNKLRKTKSNNECLIYNYLKKIAELNVTPFIYYGYLCYD